MRIARILLLFFAALFPLRAQSPIEGYRAAVATLNAHSSQQGFGFGNDGSPEARQAVAELWQASSNQVIETLAADPDATPKQIETALCSLDDAGCTKESNTGATVLQLKPQLFLIAQTNGEMGTVFLVGPRDGKPSLLWSIASRSDQPRDEKHLLSAWLPSGTGFNCHNDRPDIQWGRCGPVFAAIGALPPDSVGNARFYLDAEYAQGAGATVGKQFSIWSWNGSGAKLLWIGSYLFMIDQPIQATESHDGILSLGEKEEYRSFFSCGSCDGKQVIQRFRIAPNGIFDLGKHPVDLLTLRIDELFWRIAHNLPTASIASPQVVHFLQPRLAEARNASQKIEKNWFSVGMANAARPIKPSTPNLICFNPDELGPLVFTVQPHATGQGFFTYAADAKPDTCDW